LVPEQKWPMTALPPILFASGLGTCRAARAARREQRGASSAARAARREQRGASSAARAARREQRGASSAARAARREQRGASSAARAARPAAYFYQQEPKNAFGIIPRHACLRCGD